MYSKITFKEEKHGQPMERRYAAKMLAHEVYNYILLKVEQLRSILRNYTIFGDQFKLDKAGFEEMSTMMLYNAFQVNYIDVYSSDDMRHIVEYGISQIAAKSHTYNPEDHYAQFLLLYDELLDNFYKVAQKARNDGTSVLDYLPIMYLTYLFCFETMEQIAHDNAYYENRLIRLANELYTFWRNFFENPDFGESSSKNATDGVSLKKEEQQKTATTLPQEFFVLGFPDYYRILGLPRFYPTQEEIKAAHSEKLQSLFVNRSVPQEAVLEWLAYINNACNTLTDASEKRKYDEVLAGYISESEGKLTHSGQDYLEALQPDSESRLKAEVLQEFWAKRKTSTTPLKTEGEWKQKASQEQSLSNSHSLASKKPLIKEVPTFKTDNVRKTLNLSRLKQYTPHLVIIALCIFALVFTLAYTYTPPPVALTRPANGAVLFASTVHRESELEIVTRGERDYFIRLRYADTHEEAISFYVRGGMSATVTVPTGRYILTYASGETWYGTDQCFGTHTFYARANDIFLFTRTSGWTIELYSHINDGNLTERKISASEF